MKKQENYVRESSECRLLRQNHGSFDIILNECMAHVCAETGKVIHRLSEEVAWRLESYSWPGDLPELHLVLRSAVISSRDRELSARDLPEWFCN